MRHLPLLSFLMLLGGCSVLQIDRPPERDAAMRLEQGLASLDAGMHAEAFEDLAWVYTNCAGYEASHQALAALAALELDPRNRGGREAIGSELLGRLVQHPGPPAWTRPMAETAYLMALALGAPPAAADSAARRSAAADPTDRVAAHDVRVATDRLAAAADSVDAVPPGPGDAAGAAGARDSAGAVQTAGPVPPTGPTTPVREQPEPVTLPVPQDVAGPAYGCGGRVSSEDWVTPGLPTLPGPSLVALLTESEMRRQGLAARTDSLARALTAAQRELDETRSELERIRKTLKP